MKPQKIEWEGALIDERGYLHTDTGDPWHAYMPEEFWTKDARRLFSAALDAGIIELAEGDTYFWGGRGITKGQLAYWCVKACQYLGLNRGSFCNWKPFDEAFGFQDKPLRNALHSIGYYAQDPFELREDLTDPIDKFFKALDGEPAPGTDPSTITSTEDQ